MNPSGRLLALLALLLLAAAPAVFADAQNLMVNGDFAAGRGNWELPPGATIEATGPNGSAALRVTRPQIGFSFAQQSIPLDGRRVHLIHLAAQMRWANVVRGPNSWEGARMHMTFHDATGKQLGGWPDAGIFTGTSDWRLVERDFEVPLEAARGVLNLGFQNASGTVWFADVRLTDPLAGGSRTDTTGWLPFTPPPDDFAPSPIDVSWLLDRPAGKHGFIRVRTNAPAGGPMLQFEDGAPARFWGVDVVHGWNCFPDHATAERVAARLARAGCNLVRFHHVDAPWNQPINLFDPRYDDTQHLSAEALERWDYFMAQLKQQGIYFFVDLLVSRQFKAGDGVRDWQQLEPGVKMIAEFDPRLIELQKLFATQLMTHRNPYTGLRLIDDPAVAFQDIINESSLFWGELDKSPPGYMAELRQLFSGWLSRRYPDRAALAAAWARDPRPLAADEDPAQGTVRLAPGQQLDAWTSEPPTPRVRDTLGFLSEVQTRYFEEMRDHLRSLGARYLITGSNHWTNSTADFATQLSMDFMDRHNYWAHPQGGYGWQGIHFENRSALVSGDGGDPASSLSRQIILGKPYTVSEWQYSWPNEYCLEGLPLTAGYAALQGWDAALQFDFSGGDWAKTIDGNFDPGNKPDQWAQWPAMALLFHRGDVSPDPTPQVFPTSSDPAIDRERVGSRLPPGIESREGVRIQIGPAPASTPSPGPPPSGGSLERRQGLFLIHSPRTQAIVGFLKKAGTVSADATTLESPTEFGSVIVSSLTDQPINRSNHLLITTVGRAENSGMVYGPRRDKVLDAGRAPILMDPVRGTLRLQREGGWTYHLYRLDGVGHRAGELTPAVEGSTLRIPLDGEHLTLWYELVAEPLPAPSANGLQVELAVDRGCGASYHSGEPLTLTYRVSRPALLTLKVVRGGVETVLFAERSAEGGVSYPLPAVASSPGERRFILEAVAGDQRSRAECSVQIVP